jgi:uncharacterized protein with FMN-binding domain
MKHLAPGLYALVLLTCAGFLVAVAMMLGSSLDLTGARNQQKQEEKCRREKGTLKYRHDGTYLGCDIATWR